jgi:hypothetical protein
MLEFRFNRKQGDYENALAHASEASRMANLEASRLKVTPTRNHKWA